MRVGKQKQAHYGLKDSRKPQWCSGCAKQQEGETERIGKGKMCEDCKEKWAHYGQAGSKLRQWCGTCASGGSWGCLDG
eukprot:COSAG04_NODE_3192_length_3065_cov_21.232558_3_plen_78_part_00